MTHEYWLTRTEWPRVYGSLSSSASASDCTLARNSSSSRRACAATRSSRLSLIGAVLEHQPALLQRLRDARAHFLELIRLDDVVHRADREAAHRDLDVGHGGDHHDRDVGVAARDLAEQLEAVHLRHAQVAQHERDRVVRSSSSSASTPFAGLDALEAVAAHQVHEHLAQARLVVDDQAAAAAASSRRGRMIGIVATGSVDGSLGVARRLSCAHLRHHTESIGMTRVFDDGSTIAGFGTRAIHAGQRPEPLAGAIMTPVYLTSTYVQEGLGQNKGYEYARGKNPTREALERNVAALERRAPRLRVRERHGLPRLDHEALPRPAITSSAARTSTAARSGCSTRFCSTLGLRFTLRRHARPAAHRRRDDADDARRPRRDADESADADHRPRRGGRDRAPRAARCSSSTTRSRTPYFQRPLELGADIVFHSTTKYLNGHSDMIGGIAVVQRRRPRRRGCSSSTTRPARCRAVRRLARAARHQDAAPAHARSTTRTAARSRAWLAEHVGRRERLLHPGLPSHPQHELAKRQMTGFGGMISVELGTQERAAHVLERVRIFSLAESLGGVESLISQPASMTHASVPPERRARARASTDGLIRLSLRRRGRRRPARGDLEQAFARTLTRRQSDAVDRQPSGAHRDSTDSISVHAPGSTRPTAPRSTRCAPSPASTRSCARSPGFFGERGVRSSSSPTRCGSARRSARLNALYRRCSRRSTGRRDGAELYVTQTPIVNAMARRLRAAVHRPELAALLELLDEEEQRVHRSRHELGHIMSGHVTYTTIALILLMVGVTNLPFLAAASRCCRSSSRSSSGIARPSSRATAPDCSACRTRASR